MLSKSEFDGILGPIADPTAKIQTLGALLAKNSGMGSRLVIAGGSAISIYSHGRYTSGDIDVVGDKARIAPILRRWGFASAEDPDGRVYWTREDLGLVIDIIHRSPSTGSGRSGRLRKIVTDYGPVSVSAVEDLIVRRLVFWSRDGKPELMDQAVALYVENREEIDVPYLEGEIGWERADAAYRELLRLAGPGFREEYEGGP
ncbi:MAG: hypothetical protein WBG19_02650 [Thermoplasmata archaeon]